MQKIQIVCAVEALKGPQRRAEGAVQAEEVGSQSSDRERTVQDSP